MPDGRKRIADAAFLVALMVYVMAGIAYVPMHGDEFMFMAMSHDVFYMANGQWDRIAYSPPVLPDTEQYLRLLNGTIPKDTIGVAWMLNGRSADSLPQIYAWAMPLDWNQVHGNVPTMDELQLARIPSALMTALGVIPMFLLGWQLRRRLAAYPATLLYTLHPVLLLNGRRAMSEGGLMLFTLLTMAWLVAMIVAEHSATADGLVRRLSSTVRYVILGVLCGLTVAAKDTGVIIVFTALVAAFAAGLIRGRSWRPLLHVVLSGVIALVVWFALNPAFWNNPPGALKATITARAELLAEQSTDSTLAYKTVGQRLQALVTQPFLTPSQYYEAPGWAGVLDSQIQIYETSSVDGWSWGVVIGVILTALAIIGLISLCFAAIHRDLVAWAVLIWFAAVIVASLAVPLSWQRYYLPLIVVDIVLAAAGAGWLLSLRKTSGEQTL